MKPAKIGRTPFSPAFRTTIHISKTPSGCCKPKTRTVGAEGHKSCEYCCPAAGSTKPLLCRWHIPLPHLRYQTQPTSAPTFWAVHVCLVGCQYFFGPNRGTPPSLWRNFLLQHPHTFSENVPCLAGPLIRVLKVPRLAIAFINDYIIYILYIYILYI